MCQSPKQVACKRCDTLFTPSKGFKTMCSHECKYNKRLVSEEAVQKRASKLSRKVKFTCQNDECGIEFEDKPSSKRKYCSPSCSSKHRMNNPEFKAKARERAIKQGLGGNVSRGMHGYYTSPTAGEVFLESSYEFSVAEALDAAGVRWIRPSKKSAFVYSYPEEDKDRRYFPDFYLLIMMSILIPRMTIELSRICVKFDLLHKLIKSELSFLRKKNWIGLQLLHLLASIKHLALLPA